MGYPDIEPPLVNSAGPWATTKQDLQGLFSSGYIGAVTVRTATLTGFEHDDAIHQFAWFEPAGQRVAMACDRAASSMNSLGYSPYSLGETLGIVKTIIEERRANGASDKPVIISITGSPQEVQECIRLVDATQRELGSPFLVEINLSCPNISGKPPPAFTLDGICEYLDCLRSVPDATALSFGIKTPPYSNPDSFGVLKQALMAFVSPDSSPLLSIPLSFITATNTLGCCLLLDSQLENVIASADGSGIGGMAGISLQPLALGNVRLIRKLLDSEDALSNISIIGVGGVSDELSFKKMRAVGASVVGVGTAFGRVGTPIFKAVLPTELHPEYDETRKKT